MISTVQRAIECRPPGSRLVLLSDFDGTLADFHPDPAVPMLTSERRALLEVLSLDPAKSVGLVSGRRLVDLRRRTALPSCVYFAGTHGMEIAVDGRHWRHPDLGLAKAYVGDLTTRLNDALSRIPGVLVEDKEVSVALHTRGTPLDRRAEAEALAEACAAPWLASGQLKRLEGNAVIEYLPNISCHKGDATQWIADDVGERFDQEPWVVFLGDDVTDEDAFKVIDRGIGVLIGSRPTAASHQLPSIAEVDALLRWLSERE
ncbi:MAG: trehalose-phosphatase [Acidobacteria bacterium]|nr:trehalose-phosphatase [Acidobacteriota bacterium]